MSKARPPELSSNQLVCFQEAGMAGGWVIIVMGNNGAAEVQVVGNVKMALVHKDASIVMPIRETRAEGGGTSPDMD